MPPHAVDGRRARGFATRTALIEAAITLMRKRGLDALTLRSTAAEADVSVPLTTYHFGTLDDLRAAAVEEMSSAASTRLRGLAQLTQTGQCTLTEACTRYIVGLIGPNRGDFLVDLEIQIRAARNPADPVARLALHRRDAMVELIDQFVDDSGRARALHAALFGYASIAVLSTVPPELEDIRTFVRSALAGTLLPERVPAQ
ncbi:TetR/AcrR family transcriptional regulator [Mycobacteroides abscessus]|uniref:TetR/AcrR family transcriptional regulator n=1 Tax=Mycobacteroides abscessus TaxID=36809 RepID=UPI000C25F896|nr:TetR family transcriptional regulator [Mycobacteroides abscessus]